MKLGTLIEGDKRKCGCKNGSSITSNYRFLPFPFLANISLSEAYLRKYKLGLNETGSIGRGQ